MKKLLILFFCILSLSIYAKKLYVNENYNKKSWEEVLREAEKGNVSAMNILGRGYGDHYWAFDKKLTDKKRFKYLRTAAEYGYPYAMAELEVVYSQGLLGAKSNQELSQTYRNRAVVGFKRYANMGDVEAMVAYSDRLSSSELSEKTYWLLYAAHQGNVDAIIEMVNLYGWGIYTSKNPVISNAWRARLILTKNATWDISFDVDLCKKDLKNEGYSEKDYEKLAYPTYLQVSKYSVDEVELINKETERLLAFYQRITPQKATSDKLVASKGKTKSASRTHVKERSNGKRNSGSVKKATSRPSTSRQNTSSARTTSSACTASTISKTTSHQIESTIKEQGFPVGQIWYFSQNGKGGGVWKIEFYIDKLGYECCKIYNHKWVKGLTYVHDGTHKDGSYKFTYFNGYSLDMNAAMRGQRKEVISYFGTSWNTFAHSLSFTKNYRTMIVYPYPEKNVFSKCTKQQFDVRLNKLKQMQKQNYSSPSTSVPGTVTTPSRPKMEWQKQDNRSLVSCSACGGTGRCLSCNGTGDRGDTHNWDDTKVYMKCTSCSGSGRCYICRGTGHIRR